jgi:bifunctional DNase/RNase
MSSSRRLGVLALIVGALTQTASARERADSTLTPPAGTQEVTVVAVVLDERSQSPTVLLEGKRDKRQLAMAIGPAEAISIVVPLRGATLPRPLTHDLFLTLFGQLNVAITRVVINDVRDGIYYATVHLSRDGTALSLDARPSDAIALAIRSKVPVLVEDRVFDKGETVPLAPARPRI